MADSLKVEASNVIAGLGTFVFTVLSDGWYTVQCESTIPENSALALEVKLDATSKVTAGGATANPTPTQKALGAATQFYATAGQVISALITSSAAVDVVNSKTTVNLFKGK